MTGAELRAALDELGITQREFARRTGKHKVTVSNMTRADDVPRWAEWIVELLRERPAQRAE